VKPGTAADQAAKPQADGAGFAGALALFPLDADAGGIAPTRRAKERAAAKAEVTETARLVALHVVLPTPNSVVRHDEVRSQLSFGI
jgi:hypothetical protein